MRNTNKSGFRWKRSGILLAAVIVLLAGAVGGTWAFLVAQSEPVQNNFTYAHVSCTINEEFDGTTKSDVQIQNTGDLRLHPRPHRCDVEGYKRQCVRCSGERLGLHHHFQW